MTCLITTLTILSVYSNGIWNDVRMTTDKQLAQNRNMQASVSIEYLTPDVMRTRTRTIICGDFIDSVAVSSFEVK